MSLLADIDSLVVRILVMEGTVEKLWSRQFDKVLVLIGCHLLLDLSRLVKVTRPELCSSFRQQIHHVVIVEGKLQVGNGISLLGCILVLVHSPEPILKLGNEKFLESLDCVVRLAVDQQELFIHFA